MPKRTIKKVAFYIAGGIGKLPEDMLRYDIAFVPSVSLDPITVQQIVAFPQFQERGRGHWGGYPTEGRWGSFCWKLIAPPTETVEKLRQHFEEHPDQWFTARHPRSDDGPTDYETLVKVSLADYLAEER